MLRSSREKGRRMLALLKQMLHPKADARPAAAEVLQHSFFKDTMMDCDVLHHTGVRTRAKGLR